MTLARPVRPKTQGSLNHLQETPRETLEGQWHG